MSPSAVFICPRKLRVTFFWGLLGVIFLSLTGCTYSSGFSGPTLALPTDQVGSLSVFDIARGNCYAPDSTSTACSTSAATTGTNGITALATVTYGSNNALFLGDTNGNIYTVPVTSSTTPSTPASCLSGGGASITSLALIPGTSSPGTLFYSTSSGVSTETAGTSSCSTLAGTSITSNSFLTYSSSGAAVVGATSSGNYFSCTAAPTCTSHGTLPNLSAGTTVSAIAADPQYAAVYVITSSGGTDSIYFYSLSGTGTSVTLTFIGSYTGIELEASSGLALFHGNNPTQQYCTTGGCTFMDVVNAGDNAITQYVLTYNLSGSTPTSVTLNQFNSAYVGCDLFDSLAIAAITPTTGVPAVFAGQNGTAGLGPCLGVSNDTSFGNSVTAYTVVGE